MPSYNGNPKSYLKNPGNQENHFTSKSSYRGNMHVGISDSPNEVGNQPKEKRGLSLESFSNKANSIPKI